MEKTQLKLRTERPRADAERGKRDAVATKERILKTGIEEFAQCGYSGARIDRIAKRAEVNVRMIYHYFGGKEQLYRATLERIYVHVRTAEKQLHLSHLLPTEGMVRLVEFTFDYLVRNPEFVRLVIGENLLKGEHLRCSTVVPGTTLPLVRAIEDLLQRGQQSGELRPGVDPVQLYVSILSLCFIHISNRYTLLTMFQTVLADARWPGRRRRHVVEVILGYLKQGGVA